MSVSFRSAATATATARSVVVNAPAGMVAGDQLLAIVWTADDSATFSAPSGWSSNGVYQNPGTGGSHVSTQGFQKVAGASEPGSYTFTATDNQPLGAAILDYTGGTVDVQNTKNSGTSTAASQVAASLTTTQASELVVAFWTQGLGAGAGITLPGGLTSRASITGYSGKQLSLNVGEYTGPGSPGVTAPGTATGDNTYWASITVALKTPSPAAPTLLTPSNASYLDVQALGGPFSWQYNTNGASGGETGYHFRRKISGGAYSYWNAGTPAFQGTDVANTSTATSLTYSASVWSDGNTYNWSVASVDAGGTGSYAADFVVNSQAAPSVTISAPTGTWTTNQTPAVTWSDSLAAGASQLTYRVVTYSATQYGAGGFAPGVGPSLDDSGVVNSNLVAYTVVNPIANGTACRSYVQVVQTPGGQASAWTFTSYTIAIDVPVTPTVTAVAGNDPSTGCPRVTLTVQCQDNLLTNNQSCLSAGNTTGWTAGGGTTLSAVGSPVPPAGVSSNFVMQMAGAVSQSAQTPTGLSGFAVLPNTSYTGQAWFRSASTARACTVAINWYTAAGASISSSTSGSVNDSNAAWTQALITATSPGTAAFAAVTVADVSAAENHFVTEIGLNPGTVAAWSIGGFVGSSTLAILRSDGLYVRLASTANPASIPSPSETVVVYDYEATPTVSYTYSATVSVVLGGPAGTLASAAGTSSAAIIPGGQGFWELDPTNYPSAVNANPTQWNPSQIEQSTAHPVLGQTTRNVVAYAVQAHDFTATFETFTAAAYQGLVSLSTSQKAIFVSDPFGLSYYFRLALSSGGGGGGGSTAHSSQTMPSSANAPHRAVSLTAIAQPRPIV